jgi:hypothetical protein
MNILIWEQEKDIRRDYRRIHSPNEIDNLLKCIPWTIRDSWNSNAPLAMETPAKSSVSYRRYFLKSDRARIFMEWAVLTPNEYVAPPEATLAEVQAGRAEYDRLLAELPVKKEEFIKKNKDMNTAFMEEAVLIDELVRKKLTV